VILWKKKKLFFDIANILNRQLVNDMVQISEDWFLLRSIKDRTTTKKLL